MNTNRNKEKHYNQNASSAKKSIKSEKNHTSDSLLSTLKTKNNNIIHTNFNVIRFGEMNNLFSKKLYTEWAVMSENHTRAYIKLLWLSYLNEDASFSLIDTCEKKFPTLRWSLHLSQINNIFFITIEPLLAWTLNKDIIKDLTDYIVILLESFPWKK